MNDALAQTLAEDSTLKDALKRSSLLFFSAEQHDVAPILYRIPLVALSPLAMLLLSQKGPSLLAAEARDKSGCRETPG